MFKHLGLIQRDWWNNQALCIRHERHLNTFQFHIYVWHFQDLLLSHFLSRKLGLCVTQLFKHFQINTFGEKKSGWRMYLLPLLIHNLGNKPRQLFIFNLFRAECVRKFSHSPKCSIYFLLTFWIGIDVISFGYPWRMTHGGKWLLLFTCTICWDNLWSPSGVVTLNMLIRSIKEINIKVY